MRLLDILAPKSCAFCGESSKPSEQNICTACYADLPWASPAVSLSPGVFDRSIAMLDYEFPVDVTIKAMKFNRKLYYAPAFGQILCSASVLLPPDIDAVLPVPLHWRRKTRRGFNQAAEIAGPVARMLEVPIARGVRRIKATPFQSGLGAVERARNLKDAFAVRAPFRFQHILIIDDVTTTGATLSQLANTLRRNNVDKVSALTVARVN